MLSNSRGEYIKCNFSIGEINYAKNILEKLLPIITYTQSIDDIHTIDLRTFKTPDYQSNALGAYRMRRAFNFLVYAQQTSFVPLKVCFYLIVFESLLAGLKF